VKRIATTLLLVSFSLLMTVCATSCLIFGWGELVISGTVSGLVGEATLTLSDGQEFVLSENGEFSVVAEFERNVDYGITVSQWPDILGLTFDTGTPSDNGREMSDVSIDFYHLAFFSAFDGTGDALWKTDGTPDGTLKVRDFDFVRLTRQGTQPNTAFLGTNVYFRANDGGGETLWKSDGTVEGTVELGGLYPSYLCAFAEKVFFRSDDPTHGSELWWSDGTTEGTQEFADIYEGSFGSAPGYLTVMGNELFFSAWYDLEGGGDHGLWKTDGTVNGTVRVANINESGLASPGYTTVAGDLLYFSAYDDGYGYEPFISDGTESGTMMLADLEADTGSSYPSDFAAIGEIMLFSAQVSLDRELWKSDGTGAGTELVENINVGSSSNPEDLTVLGGLAYFVADDGVNGEELWASDGTPAGTLFVIDVNADATDSELREMQTVGGSLFFFVDHPDYGHEPWVFTPDSAGFSGSAGLLVDINAGPEDGYVQEPG
jgi:ELWxxDGT repeat protein